MKNFRIKRMFDWIYRLGSFNWNWEKYCNFYWWGRLFINIRFIFRSFFDFDLIFLVKMRK